MRKAFYEWYPPDPDDVAGAWSTGFIVFDTNFLLSLYRYPDPTLHEVSALLRTIADRLWLPYQVGLEFQKLRITSLSARRRELEALLKDVCAAQERIENLQSILELHSIIPSFEDDRILAVEHVYRIRHAIQEAIAAEPEQPVSDALKDDSVLSLVTELYENRVGRRPEEEELEALYAEGRTRYDKQVPPGYADANKEEPRRYGDFVLWNQLLREGAKRNSACILVTTEKKEDWWRRHGEHFLSARTELLREYREEVGKLFILYRPEDFLRDARKFTSSVVSGAAISDVAEATGPLSVERMLRRLKMFLPSTSIRKQVLLDLYEALVDCKPSTVGELSESLLELGEIFESPFTRVPLFFALINETYGPVRTLYDPKLRLRDRRIERVRHHNEGAQFIRDAETAWLAQALFRLEASSFTEEEYMGAFFGEDHAPEDRVQLLEAQAWANRDRSFRMTTEQEGS